MKYIFTLAIVIMFFNSFSQAVTITCPQQEWLYNKNTLKAILTNSTHKTIWYSISIEMFGKGIWTDLESELNEIGKTRALMPLGPNKRKVIKLHPSRYISHMLIYMDAKMVKFILRQGKDIHHLDTVCYSKEITINRAVQNTN